MAPSRVQMTNPGWTRREDRLTLRQFQHELRGDGRCAVLMWRVLKIDRCEPLMPGTRILPGSPVQGDGSPVSKFKLGKSAEER